MVTTNSTVIVIAAAGVEKISVRLRVPNSCEQYAEIYKAGLPELNPGDVVAMDNLSSHKAPVVREMIEAAGASLLHLPPCSPDFNPPCSQVSEP